MFPVSSDAGILNQVLAIIKEISGREIYVFNIYTMAVFWLQTCSFRKFI